MTEPEITTSENKRVSTDSELITEKIDNTEITYPKNIQLLSCSISAYNQRFTYSSFKKYPITEKRCSITNIPPEASGFIATKIQKELYVWFYKKL